MASTNEETTIQLPYHIQNGSVKISIEEDAALPTKSNDADYFTVTGRTNNSELSIILENHTENNFLFQRQFTATGQFLALLTFHNGNLVCVELNPDLEKPTTKGFFTEMNECIKTEYVKMRDNAAKNYPVQYDFLTEFVYAVSLVYAIVDCSQKV